MTSHRLLVSKVCNSLMQYLHYLTEIGECDGIEETVNRMANEARDVYAIIRAHRAAELKKMKAA